MGDLDVLFVHPVVTRRGRPIHVILPLGLFSLAHCLQEEGFQTEILNVGVEKLLDGDFELGNYVKQRSPRVVGIDLHWYTHSYVAIEAARTVKKHANALVVLGGFTASYFAEEIMKQFPFVDVVLRGEAERPLVELVKQHTTNQDYVRIPNCTFRRSSEICHNRISHAPKHIDNLPNSGLDLLRNWDKYLTVKLMWDPSPYAYFDSEMPKSFDLCISRGCPYQCSYCGGGREAQRMISGRDGVCFKSPEKVLEEAIFLKEKGVEEVRLPYLGYPRRYLRLFDLIKGENLGLSCRISFWNLARKDVVRRASEAFWRVSVDISPDSGSENVRRLNKGPHYSNRQLVKTLRFLETNDSSVDLYFTVGLPGETQADFQETMNLAVSLILDNSNIANAYSFGVNAEPGSPMFREPDRYGVILSRRSFLDFYSFWETVEMGLKPTDLLGLRRKDRSQDSIVEMSKKLRSRVRDALTKSRIGSFEGEGLSRLAGEKMGPVVGIGHNK